MLLLTLNEWLGPGRRHPDRHTMKPEQRVITMATRRPLGEALLHLKRHEVAYKQRYTLAVEFRLLGVSTIEDLTREQLEAGAIEDLDRLPQTVEEFE